MPPKKKSVSNEMVNYYQHIPKKFLNNVPNPQYNQHFIKTMFRMCVCAPSGSGKTTFVLNLLQRFSSGEGTFSKIYIITKDSIEYNGKSKYWESFQNSIEETTRRKPCASESRRQSGSRCGCRQGKETNEGI